MLDEEGFLYIKDRREPLSPGSIQHKNGVRVLTSPLCVVKDMIVRGKVPSFLSSGLELKALSYLRLCGDIVIAKAGRIS